MFLNRFIDALRGEGEITPSPEQVDPHLSRSIKYILHHEDKLKEWSLKKNRAAKQPGDFSHLTPVFDALKLLDPDLNFDKNSESPMKVLLPFALSAADKLNTTVGDALSQSTVIAKELKGKRRKQPNGYWWENLSNSPKEKQSLSYRGGVYEFQINIDKKSTTNGGEELQQATTALALHFAHGTSIMTDKPIPHAYETLNPQQLKLRSKQKKDSISFLSNASNNKSAWASQSYLSHIQQPITSSSDRYSHDNNIVLNELTGKFIRRETLPSQDIVRLFRSSSDYKTGYYTDMLLSDFQKMKGEDIGNMLIPSDDLRLEITNQGKATKIKWTSFNSVEDIKFMLGEAPAFSISSGINEIKNTVVQEATTCGRSKAHIAYDFDMIILQPNHVSENGAPFKNAVWGVAQAVQVEAKSPEQLLPGRLPKTEIRPPYNDSTLPSKRLLEKSQRSPDAQTIDHIINYFGLSDVRFRFPDITPKQAKPLVTQLNSINMRQSKRLEQSIKAFIKQNPGDQEGELKEKDIAYLVSIIAPPMGIDDLITAKTSMVIGRPAACNTLPFQKSFELCHNSIPKPDIVNGKPTIATDNWQGLFDADKTLSRFGLNIYNIFKNNTRHWREGILGAESLSRLFSDQLADYADLSLHHSTLSTHVRNLNGKLVTINGFETADPGEPNAIGMSTLSTEEGGSYRIKVRFRDRLTKQKLDVLPIYSDDDSRAIVDEVSKELTQNLSPREKTKVKGLVIDLFDKWNKAAGTNSNNQSNQLLQMVIDNEASLRKSDKNDAIYKAFQILLVSGMRQYHIMTVNDMLNNPL